MQHKAQFGFQTRYFDSYYKKDCGELIIVGQAKFMPDNIEPEWLNIDRDVWEVVFSFDIDSIIWNGIDITKLYKFRVPGHNQNNILDSGLFDVIEDATYSHLEWVFKAEIAQAFGREMEYEPQDDTTDRDQHIDYPTAEQMQMAFEVIRKSSKHKTAA